MTKIEDLLYPFDVNKRKAIELLAEGNLSQNKIAELIGIYPQTLSKWKTQQNFMEAVVLIAQENLKAQLPAVYKELAQEAKRGNHKHIKILLDHLASLEKSRDQIATITFSFEAPTSIEEDE